MNTEISWKVEEILEQLVQVPTREHRAWVEQRYGHDAMLLEAVMAAAAQRFVAEVFDEILAADPIERDDWLKQHYGNHPHMIKELCSLLEFQSEESVLEINHSPTIGKGTIIGKYRIDGAFGCWPER